MSAVIDILSWVCIIGGVFFSVVGAIGMLRFPEFWTRLHAASVAESGGMILLVLGMCLQAGWSLILVKLILIGFFLFVTGPTSSHAVANAALVSGQNPVVAKKAKKKRT
ncbi:MAG: monovalent cation/H(+) antiporter subunit G [Pseudomonadota bacterium]